MNTTLIDIYEAAGGTVNEDRTQVSIEFNMRKPFKIELLVYPTIIETGYLDRPEEVTFGIVLDDEHTFDSGPLGHEVRVHEFYAEVKLPVSQVKIVKE